jgi:small conductance mechanosensitive channel
MWYSIRHCLISLAVLLLVPLSFAGAAPPESTQGVTDAEEPPEWVSLEAEIESLEADAERYGAEYRRAEGEDKELAREQLNRAKAGYRESLGKLVKVLGETDEGSETLAQVRSRTLQRLRDQRLSLREDIEDYRKLMAEARASKETVADEALLGYEQALSDLSAAQDELVKALADNAQWMQALGEDVTTELSEIDALLAERARSTAGRIELTQEQIASLKGRLAKAQEGEKETLQQRITALMEKKKGNAASLSRTIRLMDRRGLDTATYSQLLITTTGEITGDIFNTQVAAGLAQQWLGLAKSWALEQGPGILLKILVVLLVLLVFKALANLAGRLVRRAVTASKLSLSQLLQQFFVSVAAKTVMLVGVLVALSQLGVEIGPLLAGLGVAGFIVGFALQDTLSNFAAGLMLLIYRPYDVGDFIEAGGVMGKVEHMSLVSTTVLTPDNQMLLVPNKSIWGGVIRNVTAQPTRRVDLTFGIGYGDDMAKAERILRDIIESHPLVLAEPAPVIRVHALGESSVDFIVRPWVKTSDYWGVYWDITRRVKERFDAEGVSIPFPQRDIHLHQITSSD